MKKLLLLLTISAVSSLMMALTAYGFSSLLREVNTTCGSTFDCGICHVKVTGGGPLTANGTAYFNAGSDPCYFCPTSLSCASIPPPPPTPTCTDTDGDGYYKETNCGTPVDCNDNDPAVNPGAAEICNDGKDNDCDGKVDCADTGCANDPACVAPPPPPPPPTPTCTDADGDGYFKEAGCGTSVDCNDNNPAINPGEPENCTDGIDNNCDGMTDCADVECDVAVNCQPDVTPEVCNDGIDNDADGFVDCDDGDCSNDPDCTAPVEVFGPENSRRACRDGIDNDADGLIDCEDPDCASMKNCIEGRGRSCRDGIDNDADGLVDCDDPDCLTNKACKEGRGRTCSDGIDNDHDGLIDCDDPDCARNRACRDAGLVQKTGAPQMTPAVQVGTPPQTVPAVGN